MYTRHCLSGGLHKMNWCYSTVSGKPHHTGNVNSICVPKAFSLCGGLTPSGWLLLVSLLEMTSCTALKNYSAFSVLSCLSSDGAKYLFKKRERKSLWHIVRFLHQYESYLHVSVVLHFAVQQHWSNWSPQWIYSFIRNTANVSQTGFPFDSRILIWNTSSARLWFFIFNQEVYYKGKNTCCRKREGSGTFQVSIYVTRVHFEKNNL